MTLTTQTTLAQGLPIYRDRQFLAMAKPILVHYQLGQRGRVLKLQGGQGSTVYWTRYLPLAKRTTALTETTTGGISAGKAISDMRVSAEIALYGDWVEIGRLVSLTYLDKGVGGAVDIVGRQMGESIDYLCMDAIHGGDHATNRIRIDNDANYTKELTGDSGGSTSTVVDATLSGETGSTDDYWNNGYLICTDESSKAYGEVRLVSDYTHSNGTVTVTTAFSATMASKKYRLVQSTGLATTTDDMSTTGFRYAVRELKRKKALKFRDGSFAAIMPIDAAHDFMGSTTWTDAAKYQDKKPLIEGEYGKWFGVRCVEPTPEGDWREAAGTMGTYSATGAVYCIPFFGKESYGVVDLVPQPQMIYEQSWKDLGQPIPIYNTVGWEVGFASKVLNGCFGVTLMTSASA